MSMVYCLIAYFFARQKLAKILQFPIFDGSCMKLVSKLTKTSLIDTYVNHKPISLY